jgi:3-isopropylmalate/(R)-2-methylmalate dehydratase small subunit
VGSKYITERDPDILAKVCMFEYDPEFFKKVKPGDLMIAGTNFGYGHPHYQGVIALKKVGISCLIAESFYPLWYRIAIFYAFPVLECKEITKMVSLNDNLEVNFNTGQVKNINTGKFIQGEPMPPFFKEIIKIGGLVPYLKKKLAEIK